MNITKTTANNGRLGIQIFRNLVVSLLAEKHNLMVEYSSQEIIEKLGIVLFSGNNNYPQFQYLTDKNYFEIYTCDQIQFNIDPNNHFFQTKTISRFLYNYLHSERVKSNIIQYNPFQERYHRNNDLFIHIRLTDVEQYNPGLHYYHKLIQQIDCENIIITTDDKYHNTVLRLLQYYPKAKIFEYDEIITFQFGSTCKNIILSHGCFSAILGYLSFFSTVYYPKYEKNKMWCGDIFSIKNWISYAT